MNEYCLIGQNISHEEKEDVVSAEEFPSDDKAHPRMVMLVRRTNGHPYPFFTTTVMDIINKGDGCDPVTRQQFSNLVRQRAELYNQALIDFPDYKLKDLNTRELYIRWINTHKTGTQVNEEVKKTRLEASCFLQAEDLMGIFQTFNGKGSLENRASAVAFLVQTGRKWVLRHCSLKDTKYDKAYALTYLGIGGMSHVVIVHRIGEGFFYEVAIGRQDSVGGTLYYEKSYPTIISLLEQEIHNLIVNTADSGLENRL